MSFEPLGLDAMFLRAVEAEGYHTATPIQTQAIPVILSGRDLIGCAQTGTGKTAAFALPTLQRLSRLPRHQRQEPPHDESRNNHPRRDRAHRGGGRPHGGQQRVIRSLILSPTRELAAQIGESFAAYGRFSAIRHTVVYGGVSQHPQVRALRDGVEVLVATPGRLLDLMQQRHIDLNRVEILILDEADQMLDMGFIHALRRIVAHVPRSRQTLMFSATMPDEIRRLSAEWLREPVHLQVAPVATPTELVEQSVYHVEVRHKPLLLADYLRHTAGPRTLVFARTKHGADKIVRHLVRGGIHAAAIHGNKSQSARQRVLAQFKSSRPPVLVATDIAARGLDIDDVSHVVNYDLPEVPEVYVHRIGRTGRAGATGVAVSFCGRDERPRLKAIERLTRRAIRAEQLASVAASSGDASSSAASHGAKQPAEKQQTDQPNTQQRSVHQSSPRKHAAGKPHPAGKARAKRRRPTKVTQRSPAKAKFASGSSGQFRRRRRKPSSRNRQATGKGAG